jgi:hypothetical protein
MRCTEKSSRRIYEPDDNIGIAWECSFDLQLLRRIRTGLQSVEALFHGTPIFERQVLRPFHDVQNGSIILLGMLESLEQVKVIPIQGRRNLHFARIADSAASSRSQKYNDSFRRRRTHGRLVIIVTPWDGLTATCRCIENEEGSCPATCNAVFVDLTPAIPVTFGTSL